MSKRKTRKEKIQSQQRRNTRQEQIQELEQLRAKAMQLQTKIAQQRLENFKQLNIRNLKVFTNTCNFLAPFVLTAGITVGAFRLFGGGLPFHSDEITKYKTYSMDYQSSGYVTMDEEYKTNRWFDDSLPSNSLVVYTPWEFENGQFIRFKREYDLGSIDTLDLFDAVLAEDYGYVTENLKDFKEERQVANSVDENQDNGYFFQASLHMRDKEDILKYNETDLKNIVITIIELVLTLGIGGAIAYFRDFEYLWELRETNSDYQYRIASIKPIKQELKETNEKILSLSRTRGGKI